ncbi:hypothetical protein Moror_15421 [Moniliophthora roreri MCA 2997]|uniref:Reverse transcriptase-rnase h-integrase n=1 Tax=Moniliophthora roreri (strain MCA 2997) TaxID=1381753 RepID=V2W217_MONRO|nr:hypothetical protein Moror_15421 [Moniliophthora roreri MCA 2997]
MTTPGETSAPDVKPKVEQSNEDVQWAATIATSVMETINDKKDNNTKTHLPEVYKGDYKDTHQFLLNLELYFQMNPTKSNTDKKKKMTLLSLL